MISGQMDYYDVVESMGLQEKRTCSVSIAVGIHVATVWRVWCDRPYGHEGSHEGNDPVYPPDRLAWR